jgi:hypothetical protein
MRHLKKERIGLYDWPNLKNEDNGRIRDNSEVSQKDISALWDSAKMTGTLGNWKNFRKLRSEYVQLIKWQNIQIELSRGNSVYKANIEFIEQKSPFSW